MNIFRSDLKPVTISTNTGYTNVEFSTVYVSKHTVYKYLSRCVFVFGSRTYHHRSSAYNLIVCNILMKVREHWMRQ